MFYFQNSPSTSVDLFQNFPKSYVFVVKPREFDKMKLKTSIIGNASEPFKASFDMAEL